MLAFCAGSTWRIWLLSNALLIAATAVELNLRILNWLLMLQAINYKVSTSNILYREGAGVIVLLLPLGMAAGAPILIRVNVSVERPCIFFNS